MSLIHLEHPVYLVPTEPRHFIQYDMGEDRWLCTLLLKKGWRVEYSAASGNSKIITNTNFKGVL